MREYIDYEFSPVKVSFNGAVTEKMCEVFLCEHDNKNYAAVFCWLVVCLFSSPTPGQDFL